MVEVIGDNGHYGQEGPQRYGKAVDNESQPLPAPFSDTENTSAPGLEVRSQQQQPRHGGKA